MHKHTHTHRYFKCEIGIRFARSFVEVSPENLSLFRISIQMLKTDMTNLKEMVVAIRLCLHQ